MLAVWSHWSKPFAARPGGGWPTLAHYLMSCVLSVETARSHFDGTRLVTDAVGKEMLVDGVELRFDDVRLELSEIEEYDPGWWVLGKVQAFRTQDEPFVHIDNDVFLWNGLPERLTNADVLAQNPEHFTDESDYYQLAELEAVRRYPYGWLPKEVEWCRSLYGVHQRSLNTGIYGGHRVDFIQYCAELLFEMLDHRGNRDAIAKIDDKVKVAGLLEMFLPAACIEYHTARRHSPFMTVRAATLFGSAEQAYTDGEAGYYTHLIGQSKSSPTYARKLETRVRSRYPRYYERCMEYSRFVEASLDTGPGLDDSGVLASPLLIGLCRLPGNFHRTGALFARWTDPAGRWPRRTIARPIDLPGQCRIGLVAPSDRRRGLLRAPSRGSDGEAGRAFYGMRRPR